MDKLKTVSTVLILIVAFSVLFLIGGPAAAESIRDSITGELEFKAYYNDVSGNEDLSFMTEGANVLSDVYFYYQPTPESSDAIHWKGMLYMHGTDDPQYQVQGRTLRVQNIYLTANRPEVWEVTGGYFSEQYSGYTMNSTLLGVNSWYNFTPDLTLRALGGRVQRARTGEQYARYAGGFRLDWTMMEGQSFNFTYMRTKDDDNSLTGSSKPDNPDTITNTVKSTGYEGTFFDGMFNLNAEWARSDYDTGLDTDNYDGEDARKVEMDFTPVSSSRFEASYEEVDPNFRTAQGFASKDKERYEFYWDQQVAEPLRFDVEYITWEDGVESVSEHGVDNWISNIYYQPGEAGYWQPEFSLSVENREDDGGDTDKIENKADEFTWEAELSNQFTENHELNLSYYQEDDDQDSEVSGIWRVDYSGNYEQLGLPVDHNFFLEYREDENDLGGNEEIDRRNRVENRLIFGQGEKEEIDLFHNYQNEHADGQAEIVKHNFGLDYTYLINRKFDSKVSLGYEQTDSEDKGSTDDYQEETLEFNYKTQF